MPRWDGERVELLSAYNCVITENNRERVPVDVELLSQELPVLPLGVGRVKGGADPLTDGQGDFKGPRPCLRGDGAV